MRKITEEEIRKNTISEDTHNPEFVVKFNLAMQELSEDKYAFVTFLNAIVPYIKYFGKINKKSLDETLDVIMVMENKEPFLEIS
ncbi:hypothetical protein LCGC14_3106150 [marine sediment metagenome]|uniref:Uncharacterized protein n=1 Tax=marine sediment metagenome TaxID=412755 RepID=A0A0F8W6H4_9ZZZZ